MKIKFITVILLIFASSINLEGQTINPEYDSTLAKTLGADDYGMKMYMLVLLKSGSNTTKNKALKDSLFNGHLENINKLVNLKKIVVAGPLVKNENSYRGIFILDVAAVEEATKLLESDPAIKADLLKPELYQWYGSAALPKYLDVSDKIWKIGFSSTENNKKDMDPIINISTILHCPIDTAFTFFSENSKLEQWLTVKANVEMKVGGKYELFWSPEDPDLTNNSTYGCKVLAIDKPNYFNIEWTGNSEQKSFMNTVSPLTNVTFIFSEIDENKTKVTLLHTGWRSGLDWDEAREYFVKAWSGALLELERLTNN